MLTLTVLVDQQMVRVRVTGIDAPEKGQPFGQEVRLRPAPDRARLGMAWHYKAYAREQRSDDFVFYAHAEKLARDTRAGLSSEAVPVAPWEYRHERRLR